MIIRLISSKAENTNMEYKIRNVKIFLVGATVGLLTIAQLSSTGGHKKLIPPVRRVKDQTKIKVDKMKKNNPVLITE